MDKLNFQPGFGWDNTVKYAGWLEIPSAYFVCEKDACFPPSLQRRLAEDVKSFPIVACDAGHMAPITQPQAVADFIIQAANAA